MGNGPSINSTPLELLADELVWATNGAYLLFDKISWRPDFYVMKDPLVIKNNLQELLRLVPELPETLFFLPQGNALIEKLKNLENVIFFRVNAIDPCGFSLNAQENVADSSTVTVTCLQLAFFLGFNPIYLLGCDMYYKSAAEKVKSLGQDFLKIEAVNMDTDHFHPAYLDNGDKWTVPDVDGMMRDYMLAKRICKEQGVNIFNSTVGGHLEVFPRINIHELL